MTATPFRHAALAALYIALIVLGIFYGSPFIAPEDTVFIPMAMLSLLVLSVATMAYLFFFAPLRLLLDGEEKSSRQFFLATAGYFAGFAAMFLALVFIVPFFL